MARPREFKEADAIRKATDVFWAQGYQDASLPDLLAGMGLTRGSLYKAFKDKKNLYLKVLDHYEEAAVDGAIALLTAPDVPDGAARIITLFENVARTVEAGDHRGCLLCSAAAGSEMEDPEIAAAVHRGLAKLRSGFLQALKASAVHSGQSQAALTRLADLLLTQYVGTRILARSRLPLDVVQNSAGNIAALLAQPITP